MNDTNAGYWDGFSDGSNGLSPVSTNYDYVRGYQDGAEYLRTQANARP